MLCQCNHITSPSSYLKADLEAPCQPLFKLSDREAEPHSGEAVCPPPPCREPAPFGPASPSSYAQHHYHPISAWKQVGTCPTTAAGTMGRGSREVPGVGFGEMGFPADQLQHPPHPTHAVVTSTLPWRSQAVCNTWLKKKKKKGNR